MIPMPFNDVMLCINKEYCNLWIVKVHFFWLLCPNFTKMCIIPQNPLCKWHVYFTLYTLTEVMRGENEVMSGEKTSFSVNMARHHRHVTCYCSCLQSVTKTDRSYQNVKTGNFRLYLFIFILKTKLKHCLKKYKLH